MVTLRPLKTEADLAACVDLQRATWGHDFRELVPPAILLITQKVGGIATGAFDIDGRLVGFVFGLTGFKDGRPAHWSHMLAVVEPLQGRGIGQRLKHYQREHLRQLGVQRMYWTYDPLVARNAHLNLNRLGARIIEYVPDMYGHNPMSRMDSIIGSDRFVVEWELDATPPVESQSRLRAGPTTITIDPTLPDDAPARALPDGPTVLVEVPHDIQALKRSAPARAQAWRLLTRRAFLHYLARHYAVNGLARDRAAGRCFYVLTRTQP
jgi:predicted GNAT superfamily acetyltransferase